MLRGVLRLLLRASLYYAVVYFAWLPVQPLFMRSLALGSERALRLIQRPPLVTSVTVVDNVVTISSYVTGLGTPMAAWNGGTIHVYMVATIALILAVPLRAWSTRLRLLGLGGAVVWCAAMAICTVQLETLAETYAVQHLGITLHTPGEKTWLERVNGALVALGMLLLPAAFFLSSYLALWRDDEAQAPARTKPLVRGGRSGRSAALSVASLAAVALVLAFVIVARATRQDLEPRDYLDGWTKLAGLNPQFVPAQVNAGLRLDEAGRVDEAIAAYRKALGIDPDRTIARYNLGNALARKGLFADAAQAYETVLAREPDHAAAHKNLGIALLYLDRPCDALAHLERSAALDLRTSEDVRVASQIAALRSRCAR